MSLPMAKTKPWFEEGLRFKCTGCGGCCTGSPGYVWVDEDEISTMANHLNISIEAFGKKYLRKIKGRYSLIEDQQNYDCVFLKDNRCTIYNARPKQCRTYPWWLSNIRSKAHWERASQMCEGINHKDAPLIPASTILKEQDDAN